MHRVLLCLFGLSIELSSLTRTLIALTLITPLTLLFNPNRIRLTLTLILTLQLALALALTLTLL